MRDEKLSAISYQQKRRDIRQFLTADG